MIETGMGGKLEIIVCDDQEFDHALVEMYRQHDYNLKVLEWMEWKYRQNPYGDPILVIARADGKIAGMQAHIPRDFYSGNRLIRTVEAVDAFVKPAFRRSGIYQRIWSEIKRTVKDRNLVLITFPSLKSQSIGAMRNERLETLGRLDTYMKVLRPSALLKEKKLHTFGRFFDNLFKGFSRVNRIRSNSSIMIREVARFDGDLTPNQRTTAGDRSRDYLNWKFCDCPINNYTRIVFSESGEDIGFAALRCGSKKFILTVHDCVISKKVSSCIYSLTRYVWDNYPDIGVISVTELEYGPLASALKHAGFRVTHSNQVLMLDNIDESVMPLDPRKWLITRGDSDW